MVERLVVFIVCVVFFCFWDVGLVDWVELILYVFEFTVKEFWYLLFLFVLNLI